MPANGKGERSLNIPLILAAEFFERFAFYGVRSVLFLYLLTVFEYSKEQSAGILHAFIFLSYLCTGLGGYLSDRLFGRYLTASLFLLTYALGALLLTASSIAQGKSLLFMGLFLVGLSAGCVKPSISSLGGDQFGHSDAEGLALFFNVFYLAINLGSALAFFSMPLLVGGSCFGKPSCYSFGYSLLVFAVIFSLAATLLIPLASRLKRAIPMDSAAAPDSSASSQDTKIAVAPFRAWIGPLAKMLIPISAGWMLYDQQSSSWILQGTRLTSSFCVLGQSFSVLPPQMQAVNSVSLVLLLPVFPSLTRSLFALISLPPSPRHKILCGMFLFSLSFLLSLFVDLLIASGRALPIFVQIPQIVLMTLGEALVGTTGLALSYSLAPPSCSASVLSLWYATMALGNLLVIAFSKLFLFLSFSSPLQTLSYFLLSLAASLSMLLSETPSLARGTQLPPGQERE